MLAQRRRSSPAYIEPNLALSCSDGKRRKERNEKQKKEEMRKKGRRE
jgi:hypothetical protein